VCSFHAVAAGRCGEEAAVSPGKGGSRVARMAGAGLRRKILGKLGEKRSKRPFLGLPYVRYRPNGEYASRANQRAFFGVFCTNSALLNKCRHIWEHVGNCHQISLMANRGRDFLQRARWVRRFGVIMKTKTNSGIKRPGPGRPSLGDRVKTTLRLDRELHEQLARLAKRRRVKVSVLYVRAMEFWLKRRKKVPI